MKYFRPALLAIAITMLSVLHPTHVSGGVVVFDTMQFESFTAFDSPGNKAQIAFGTMVTFPTADVGTASWYDGTAEQTIYWGRRDVYVENNNATGNVDVNPDNSGYFTITSGSNASFVVRLTYAQSNETSGSPLDISGLDDLLFTYLAFDQNIDLKLALTDASNTIAEATYNPFTEGSRLSLTGMTNWASLDKTQIKQIELTFLTNGSGFGGDVEINSGTGMAFASALPTGTVPEPAQTGLLVVASGLLAAFSRIRRMNQRNSP